LGKVICDTIKLVQATLTFACECGVISQFSRDGKPCEIATPSHSLATASFL